MSRVTRASSGIEQLCAVLRGDSPRAPIDELMGFELLEVEPGRAVFGGHPADEHGNLAGTIHGGYAALLLDSAMGCAALSTVAAGEHCATVSIELKLVSPVAAGMGLLLAEGRVEHRGRRQVTASGRLTSGDRVIAHGMTTCLIHEMHPD